MSQLGTAPAGAALLGLSVPVFATTDPELPGWRIQFHR